MNLPVSQDTVVFTDLDHTLLGAGGPIAAGVAVARVVARGVRVVPATSKTAAETLRLMRFWGLHAPAVVENGAALCVPTDANRWRVLQLARPGYGQLRATLRALRKSLGIEIQGFGDWDLAELIRRTGLSPPWACAARLRLASEPLLWRGPPPVPLLGGLRDAGLSAVTGGRFLTVLPRGTTKAAGARALLRDRRVFRRRPRVVAIGDAPNDWELLAFADSAACLNGPVPVDAVPDWLHSPHAGPRAWLDALYRLGVI